MVFVYVIGRLICLCRLPSLEFSLDLKFYLYIGITSLCLYNNTEMRPLQDGNLYKMHLFSLCGPPKLFSLTKTVLTNPVHL